MFEVIPAIDLSHGRVVRLRQGDPSQAKVYSDDAIEVGRRFVQAGARRLHVVDLDAAFGDGCAARDVIAGLAALGVPIQLGGGVRDVAAALQRLEAGATDIVVGSILAEPERLLEVVEAAGAERIIGAIDVRAGRLQIAGWVRETMLDPFEALSLARSLGVSRFLVTAVERDGTAEGPDLGLLGRFVGRGCTIWASGGVGGLSDVEAIAASGAQGVIVGRALYDGRFTLEEALGVAAC